MEKSKSMFRVKEKIANIERRAYDKAKEVIINDSDCNKMGYTKETITQEDIETVAIAELKKNDYYWKLKDKLFNHKE